MMNGRRISPFVFNKISKWIINSFVIRNNRKKSSDKTDSNFSIISKDQRQLANFFKDQSQGQKIGKKKAKP